ncbi:enolase C-terminal domain-like protein [Candidatus Latescibacterota bacterium]
MRRRSFFASAAALGAIPLVTLEVEAQVRDAGLKITGFELWQYTGDALRYNDYLTEEYPKGGWPAPETASAAPARIYLKILTDGGVEGFYGPLRGNYASQVAGFQRIIGQDPLATEAITASLANRGTISEGVAALNNALWDLKGKICNAPVYKVLGGNRKTINCYATTFRMPHALDTLDELAESSARVKAAGFNAQKWFTTVYGPSDGAMGLEFNVNMMRVLRETCGEYYDIMIDGFHSWTPPYAQAWCKRVEQYHPRWLEEPLNPSYEIEGLSHLRQVTSIPIATGEGRGNRWDYLNLLKAGAADVFQPEPERMGVSEIIRICTLAGMYGLMVSPHFMRIHAPAHIVASQPEEVCPVVEYRQNSLVTAAFFEKNPIVHNGKGQVELSDRPGFGIEIDESKIISTEKLYPEM